MNQSSKRREALLYHAKPTPGKKIQVVPTKKYATKRLVIGIYPGVAEPCLEIAKDVNNVFINILLKEFSSCNNQWNSSLGLEI
jgi:malate dehydrogenase (oxaloacetate-decarboxylating)(NADP+)